MKVTHMMAGGVWLREKLVTLLQVAFRWGAFHKTGVNSLFTPDGMSGRPGTTVLSGS